MKRAYVVTIDLLPDEDPEEVRQDIEDDLADSFGDQLVDVNLWDSPNNSQVSGVPGLTEQTGPQ